MIALVVAVAVAIVVAVVVEVGVKIVTLIAIRRRRVRLQTPNRVVPKKPYGLMTFHQIRTAILNLQIIRIMALRMATRHHRIMLYHIRKRRAVTANLLPTLQRQRWNTRLRHQPQRVELPGLATITVIPN
jgi:hypothetical protein